MRGVLGLGLLLPAACLKPDPMFRPGNSGDQNPGTEASETNNPDSHGPTSTATAEASGGQDGASSSATTGHGEFGESNHGTAISEDSASESHSDSAASTEVETGDEQNSANSTQSSGEIGGTSDASDTTGTDDPDSSGPGDEAGSDGAGSESTAGDSSDSGCAPIICLEANAGQPIDDFAFLISSTFGFRIILPEPYTRIIGATFFTGDATGENRIELWSDRNIQPDRALDEIVWPMESTPGWQGGFFSEPLTIAPGAISWLIWTGVPGSQGSIATHGNFIPYFETGDNGQTFFESSGRVRWRNRIYCCRD